MQQRALSEQINNSPRVLAQLRRPVAQKSSVAQNANGICAPIQLRAGTLAVTTARHPNSVNQIPENADYALGFQMDVALGIDEEFDYSTLQDHFELKQYVRDQYEFWDEDQNISDQQALSAWRRDSYGQDGDHGDWDSDGSSTTWSDAPGWLDNNDVDAGNLLNTYAVEFYFTVGNDDGGILHTSNAIRLGAESDDNGQVTYTTANINDAINYDPA